MKMFLFPIQTSVLRADTNVDEQEALQCDEGKIIMFAVAIYNL